ncbi:hypothetical protein [Peredibacter starrii]|uniref:Glycosyltransferase RgtA/B/C/D-like domain-containing protein n=1 Tax=Peredibacter starrii TaxID=28202 RepID=A0AAX4HQX2_9BACT|nr:hypothetical protein [Peredibacter starrii]WPU65508.1 hypothetical protein SOO65_01985 [Peredibacter starrii]
MLLPVWIQKTLEINIFVQSLLMLAYILFMAGQWYLLGKEIDHRLKIYFRANSSIDRVLYRVLIGNATMMIIFNIMTFIPEGIVRHFFWGFFVVLGLFYSWPTRGKIIEESVSTQFTEYKYLDSFEKTVLFLTLAMFVASMPSFPFFSNLETFKLIVDPEEKMHSQIWNYLFMNFYPFRKIPHLVNLGWSMHFYFVNFGLYLLAFYGIMRFFMSRRLSILGLFALVSTWSFSLFLKKDPYIGAATCFSVLWVWSILWCVKSSTYRSGLMYGLLCYTGVVLNYNNIFLFPVGLALLYFFFLKESTDWYRSQFVKYTSLGMFLILITMITHIDLRFFENAFTLKQLGAYVSIVLKRKAFYALSFLGLVSLLIMNFKPERKTLTVLTLDVKRLREFSVLVLCLILLSLTVDKDLAQSFGLLWFVVFLCILPLEWIFQSISRLRSRRNFIYMIYVILCLLDSHFEGRIRIMYNFYESPPDIVELINREP